MKKLTFAIVALTIALATTACPERKKIIPTPTPPPPTTTETPS